METSTQWLEMEDGVEVYVKKWFNPNIPPQAVLQISHGMAEHIQRYAEFAESLVNKGMVVYGNDHRGHGRTGEKMGIYGYFAEQDGFERAVEDLYFIQQTIRHEMPHLPVFMFGHSMGSFLVRRYIQKYPLSLQGVILSGTAGNPGIAGKIGQKLAQWEIRKSGGKTANPFLDRLTFGAYNKKISHPQTDFDWLSRDQLQVCAYMEDRFCGFICTNQFFYDLFSGLEKIHEKQEVQRISAKLPILLISGEHDPVGGKKLKGVLAAAKQLERNGNANTKLTIFERGRHELLNEVNKKDVYVFIYKWLQEQMGE